MVAIDLPAYAVIHCLQKQSRFFHFSNAPRALPFGHVSATSRAELMFPCFICILGPHFYGTWLQHDVTVKLIWQYFFLVPLRTMIPSDGVHLAGAFSLAFGSVCKWEAYLQ
jgi:hypothetical protein